MLIKVVIVLVILLSLGTLGLMLRDYLKQKKKGELHGLTKKQVGGLSILAVLAFIADTIGVGSFAVEIAGCKMAKLIPDAYLPGLINGAQIIPGGIESIMFLRQLKVDMVTLIVLTVGACIGGALGGLLVSRLNQRRIQFSMMLAFFFMAIVMVCNELGIFHIQTHAVALHGVKLYVGFFGMMIAGGLTCFGVGLYGVVEVLLLLLGLSPWVAFPIMTTAGALQQSFTTGALAITSRIPLKAAFLMNAVGIIGVLIALPFLTHLSIAKLHWLLFFIILYNAFMMLRSILKKPG